MGRSPSIYCTRILTYILATLPGVLSCCCIMYENVALGGGEPRNNVGTCTQYTILYCAVLCYTKLYHTNTLPCHTVASNPGIPFWILSCSFGEKSKLWDKIQNGKPGFEVYCVILCPTLLFGCILHTFRVLTTLVGSLTPHTQWIKWGFHPV